MNPPRPEVEAMADALSKRFADEGRLIEAGWVALRVMAIPPDASEVQLREMRMAYMAGAQHLFASIMGVLDPDGEPTEDDMRRMELISDELDAFAREMNLRSSAAEGSA